jgi:PAS domain S-box-containing protein
MPDLTHRLLLVEDNPGDALLVSEALSEITNYRLSLEEVTSLKQASAALEARGFDGIILDLTLPESTGLETLTHMRAISPETPIIVLTGMNGRCGLREKAEQFGAFEFVNKNELSQILPRSVHWTLRHKRAEAQHRQFERLVRSIPDAVIVTDRAAAIRFVNDAALELFGKQQEDLVGQPLGFAVAEGLVADTKSRVARSLGTAKRGWHPHANGTGCRRSWCWFKIRPTRKSSASSFSMPRRWRRSA